MPRIILGILISEHYSDHCLNTTTIGLTILDVEFSGKTFELQTTQQTKYFPLFEYQTSLLFKYQLDC